MLRVSLKKGHTKTIEIVNFFLLSHSFCRWTSSWSFLAIHGRIHPTHPWRKMKPISWGEFYLVRRIFFGVFKLSIGTMWKDHHWLPKHAKVTNITSTKTGWMAFLPWNFPILTKFLRFELRSPETNQKLVGGFNPFEKYARQNGFISFSPKQGLNIPKKIFEVATTQKIIIPAFFSGSHSIVFPDNIHFMHFSGASTWVVSTKAVIAKVHCL